MSDLSEQLDECIYPTTEEVLYSSPDGEVIEAIYLIEFQHDEHSKINLNKVAEAYSLDVTDYEVFAGADEEYPHIAVTVRGTVKSIRALSSEINHPPDVLKRLMTTIGAAASTQRPDQRDCRQPPGRAAAEQRSSLSLKGSRRRCSVSAAR